MVVSQEVINNDINSAFTGEEHQDEKRILAQHVMAIGKAWCDSQPKEFNSGSLTKGEVRKKKRDNKRALQQHVSEQLDKDRKAAEDNHAVGFLGIMTVIILAILSAVVSWVVTKLLNEYFD